MAGMPPELQGDTDGSERGIDTDSSRGAPELLRERARPDGDKIGARDEDFIKFVVHDAEPRSAAEMVSGEQ